MLTKMKIKSQSNKKWGFNLIKVQGRYYFELSLGLNTWIIGF